MSNLQKYKKTFMEVFDTSENEITDIMYKQYELWDSVGHMTLITELENTFSISLEPDDIMSFTSYEKGIIILQKYGIEI